jgi:hypothetical protein
VIIFLVNYAPIGFNFQRPSRMSKHKYKLQVRCLVSQLPDDHNRPSFTFFLVTVKAFLGL